MTYPPDYTITLPGDAKVHLLFCNGSTRRYCEIVGIEMEDLIQSITDGKVMPFKHMPNLLFAAAEAYCRYNNLPVSYNLIEADMWMDAIGGLASLEAGGMRNVYVIFVAKLFNRKPEELEAVVVKKKEELSDLPGTSSTS